MTVCFQAHDENDLLLKESARGAEEAVLRTARAAPAAGRGPQPAAG